MDKLNDMWNNLHTTPVQRSQLDFGGNNKEFNDQQWNEIIVDGEYDRYYSVTEGDIVVDIGANCGVFTSSILPQSPSKVYCVEPSDVMWDALENNTAGHPVEIIRKAIDFETGTKPTETPGVYVYNHTGVNYETISFKDFIKENKINRIDYMKFDCEGGEYSIFTKENFKFIRNHVKHIVGEWHIEDHPEGVECFKQFRDLYLKDLIPHVDFHVREREGRDVTEEIFNDQKLIDFENWWEGTQHGQYIIHVTHGRITDLFKSEE